ncbi:hypothetical protein JXA32_02240 [Candidatus Sumerlaeota bacterium]|nr:hypothetical protein [Candidatus Sumerlaeota bacterium]
MLQTAGQIARYYIALQFLALGAAPLCMLAFPRLTDRGYAAAKTLGPLIVTYLAWMLSQQSIGLAPFNAATLFWLQTALLLSGAAAAWIRREELAHFFARRWRLILSVEAAFTLGFLAVCALRLMTPEATFEINRSGSEKFFDFTLFHNLYCAETFPRVDTWFAESTLNYYYFGHLFMASIGRFAGFSPEVAYNLSLAAVAGWIAALSFSLAHQFLRSTAWAALAAWLVVAAGNLQPLLQIMATMRDVAQEHHGVSFFAFPGVLWTEKLRALDSFSFWDASRVYQVPDAGAGHAQLAELITEFPAFSILLGDLHAHYIALPLALTALLMLAALHRGFAVMRRDERTAPLLRTLPSALALTLLLGALSAANLWDYFTIGALAGALCVYAAARMWRGNRSNALYALALYIAMMLLSRHYLFFLHGRFFDTPTPAHFELRSLVPLRFSADWPVRIVEPQHRTPLSQFLTLWGLLILSLILWTAPAALWRLLCLPWRKCFFFALLILCALAFAYNAGQTLTLLFIALLFIMVLFYRPIMKAPPSEAAMRLLLAAALLLLGGVEIFYVNDVYTGANARMNTVFKTCYPLWPVFCIGAAWSWRSMLRALPVEWKWTRALCVNLLLFSVLLGALYPLMGTAARALESREYPGRAGTLNALAFLQRDSRFAGDYLLALWMRANIPPESVVIEAPGAAYEPAGRFAAWSGRPSLLGWSNHEMVWRGPGVAEHLEQLKYLIDQLYRIGDVELAGQLGAQYVVFGALEWERYGDAGALAMYDNFQLAHREGKSMLFRVPVEE